MSLKKAKSEKLIREYISNSLKKQLLEYDDYGYGYDNSYDNSYGSYGSYGSSGDLYDTFVKPFTDVIGTAVGQTKEMIRRGITVLNVAFEALMTTLVPFLTDSYDEIFEQERADLQQIRSEYQHYYDATDAAFASADANILAFLAFPTASLTGKFVSTAPKAAKGILSVLTGGLSDKSLGGSKSPSRVFDSYAREYNLLLLQEADQDSLSNKIKSKKFIEMMLQKSPIASSAASAALELHSRMLGERVKPILDIYDAKSLDDLNKTLGSKIEIPDEKELDPKAKLSAADAQRKFLDAAKSTAQKAAIEQLKKYVEPVRKTFGSDHPFVQNYDAVIDAISSGNASQVAQVKKQLGLTQSEQ